MTDLTIQDHAKLINLAAAQLDAAIVDLAKAQTLNLDRVAEALRAIEAAAETIARNASAARLLPNYRLMQPGEFNDAMSDDAWAWIIAFCQMVPGVDHETAFGWFANAIDDEAFADFVGEIAWQRRFLRDLPADDATTRHDEDEAKSPGTQNDPS